MRELIAGLAVFTAGAAYSIFSMSFAAWIFAVALLPLCIHIAWTDIRTFQIHLLAVLAIFLLGIARVFTMNNGLANNHHGGLLTHFGFLPYAIVTAVASAVLIGLLFWAINRIYFSLKGRTGIASGDILLLGTAAVWLPLAAFPIFLLVACVGALVAHYIRAFRNGEVVKATQHVPFGAFLAISLWLCLVQEIRGL